MYRGIDHHDMNVISACMFVTQNALSRKQNRFPGLPRVVVMQGSMRCRVLGNSTQYRYTRSDSPEVDGNETQALARQGHQ